MLLTDWAQKRSEEHDCKGVYAELMRKSGVSYKTVLKLARDGKATNNATVAKMLSVATRGACSPDEICFPDRHQSKHKRLTPPTAA